MLCKVLSRTARRAKLKRSQQKMIVSFDCINYKFLLEFFPASANYVAIILGLSYADQCKC